MTEEQQLGGGASSRPGWQGRLAALLLWEGER